MHLHVLGFYHLSIRTSICFLAWGLLVMLTSVEVCLFVGQMHVHLILFIFGVPKAREH